MTVNHGSGSAHCMATMFVAAMCIIMISSSAASSLNGRLVMQTAPFGSVVPGVSNYPILSINATSGVITYMKDFIPGTRAGSSVVAVDATRGIAYSMWNNGRISIINVTREGNGTLIGDVQPPMTYVSGGIQYDDTTSSLIIVYCPSRSATTTIGRITVSSLFESLRSSIAWNFTTIGIGNFTSSFTTSTTIDTANRMYYVVASAASTSTAYIYGVNIDTGVTVSTAPITLSSSSSSASVDAVRWTATATAACLIALTSTGSVVCINPTTAAYTTVAASVPNWQQSMPDVFATTSDGGTKGTFFVVSIANSGSTDPLPTCYIFAYDIATGTKINQYQLPGYPYRLVYLSSSTSSSSTIDSSSSSSSSSTGIEFSSAGLSSIPSIMFMTLLMIFGTIIGHHL